MGEFAWKNIIIPNIYLKQRTHSQLARQLLEQLVLAVHPAYRSQFLHQRHLLRGDLLPRPLPLLQLDVPPVKLFLRTGDVLEVLSE